MAGLDVIGDDEQRLRLGDARAVRWQHLAAESGAQGAATARETGPALESMLLVPTMARAILPSR